MPFYSIISAIIRPEIQEKVSIGLVLVDEGQVFLNFSKSKIKVLKELLPVNSLRAVKAMVNSIQTAISQKETNYLSTLFMSGEFDDKFFNDKNISYLSNYRQNILSFSPPTSIDIVVDKDSFGKLFEMFVDEFELFHEKEKEEKNNFESFKRSDSTREHFNINFTLSSQNIPDLIAPIKVDLAGRNEIDVFVMKIDMDKRIDYVSKDVYSFAFLNQAASEAKHFLVSSEPPKSREAQHLTWKEIRKSDKFEYVDIHETEKIQEYAEAHNVIPLFEQISEEDESED